LNGYSNLDYLGSINDFTITYPKDPSIEDIGLFNNHIKKGYPDKWKLKETAIDESTKKLEEIDEIIKKFNTKIRQIIEKNSDFRDSSIKSHENSNNKYNPNIFLEMFKEIRNERKRKPLAVTVDKKTSIYFMSDPLNTSDTIMIMNSSDYEHGRSFAVIDKILEDNELKKLVNEFNIKLVSFPNIKEGRDFIDFVTTLEENIINQNRDELEGVCKYCQLKKVIYN